MNGANPAAGRTTVMEGRYACVPNPCTTEPCLPGMAYALEAADGLYFITVDERWFAENRSWNGYTPEPGNRVRVTGYLRERRDVSGAAFKTIEAVSLQPD